MRKECAKAITELMKKDSRIITVMSDSGSELFDEITHNYPNRIYDFGICESNVIGIAAGMASTGKVPFVYAASAFLIYRAYEFIRNDVCIQNQNVKMVGFGTGITYNTSGPTHHATEDIAVLRVIPNLTILSPATPFEAYQMIFAAVSHIGPVYIRLCKIMEKEYYIDDYKFQIGKGVTIQDGSDITVVSTGSILCEVMDANEILKGENIYINIINMPTIKPLDENIIIEAAQRTKKIIVIEEHSVYGGLGGAIAEILAKNKILADFRIIGLGGFCKSYGWYQDLKKINGLSSHSLIEEIKAMVKA